MGWYFEQMTDNGILIKRSRVTDRIPSRQNAQPEHELISQSDQSFEVKISQEHKVQLYIPQIISIKATKSSTF